MKKNNIKYNILKNIIKSFAFKKNIINVFRTKIAELTFQQF